MRNRWLQALFAVFVVLELVRVVRELGSGDHLDAARALALAVLFAFFAAGVNRPVRGTAAWLAMWCAGIIAVALTLVRLLV